MTAEPEEAGEVGRHGGQITIISGQLGFSKNCKTKQNILFFALPTGKSEHLKLGHSWKTRRLGHMIHFSSPLF